VADLVRYPQPFLVYRRHRWRGRAPTVDTGIAAAEGIFATEFDGYGTNMDCSC
jgi:hypothetical protein